MAHPYMMKSITENFKNAMNKIMKETNWALEKLRKPPVAAKTEDEDLDFDSKSNWEYEQGVGNTKEHEQDTELEVEINDSSDADMSEVGTRPMESSEEKIEASEEDEDIEGTASYRRWRWCGGSWWR